MLVYTAPFTIIRQITSVSILLHGQCMALPIRVCSSNCYDHYEITSFSVEAVTVSETRKILIGDDPKQIEVTKKQ